VAGPVRRRDRWLLGLVVEERRYRWRTALRCVRRPGRRCRQPGAGEWCGGREYQTAQRSW